jgi:hypothetical protein
MEPFGTTVLAESVAVKLPAWLDTLLAKRAVSRYDHLVWVGSVKVTLKCCVTPGV